LALLSSTASAQQAEIQTGKCKKSQLDDCYERAVYALNEGTEQDQTAGVAMLEKACKWDHGPSCEVRGILLINDKIFPVDPAAAVGWFDKGCEADHASSCNRAAVQRNESELDLFDRAAAMKGFERACELGEPWGCYNAGDAYLVRDTPLYDTAKSEAFLTRACEGDNADGCNKLGVLFAMHLEDRARAIAPIMKACELGSGQGCTNVWHLGETAELEPLERWRYALRGCELGHAEGCDVIAYDGPLQGTWRMKGVMRDGESFDPVEWIRSQAQSDVPWGAEHWVFGETDVTVTRHQGMNVRDEHWVGEVDSTVGWTLADHKLSFDGKLGGGGEFAFGNGEEMNVEFWYGTKPRLLRAHEVGHKHCDHGQDACRVQIVLAYHKTIITLAPVSEMTDVLSEEVPW
jgi:hypothetical protein